MKFLKRIALGVGLLVIVAWIACAALVMFWDEGGPLSELGPKAEGHLFFPAGYTSDFNAMIWEGESKEPPEDAYRRLSRLQRGPLDRKAAEFPLSLSYSVRGDDAIKAVTLKVTSDADSSKRRRDADWLSIAGATLSEVDGWVVATIVGARAPASACAYRVEVTYVDREKPFAIAATMPTAPTLLGRLHDRVAWWPVFRWLPDLR